MRWLQRLKGYGFEEDEESADLFVNYQRVDGERYRNLAETENAPQNEQGEGKRRYWS